MSIQALVSAISEVDGKLMMSSREIAKARKWQHAHVLRTIDGLVADRPELGQSNFGASEYANSQGKSQREYLCDEKGALLVGMNMGGSNGLEFQCQLIDAFQACRDKLKAVGQSLPVSAQQIQAAVASSMAPLIGQMAAIQGALRNAGYYPDVDIDATFSRLATAKLSKSATNWLQKLQTAYIVQGNLSPRQQQVLIKIATKAKSLTLTVVQ